MEAFKGGLKIKLDYKKLEEIELIEFSQKGDQSAFEELIARNKVYLNSWIMRFTKGNEDLTKETFQLTLIKSWQKISQFKFKSTFKTWACSIARNNFYDVWAMKKRREGRFFSTEVDIDLEGSPAEVGSSLHMVNGEAHFKGIRIEQGGLIDSETASKKKMDADEKQENIKLGKELLAKIAPKHREVLVLYELEGLSYPEIAKVIHTPVGTVMSRLFYARKYVNRIWKNSKKK